MKKSIVLSLAFIFLTFSCCQEDLNYEINTAKNKQDTVTIFSNLISKAYKNKFFSSCFNPYYVSSHSYEYVIINDNIYQFRMKFNIERHEGTQSWYGEDSVIVFVDKNQNITNSFHWKLPFCNIFNRKRELDPMDLEIKNLKNVDIE